MGSDLWPFSLVVPCIVLVSGSVVHGFWGDLGSAVAVVAEISHVRGVTGIAGTIYVLWALAIRSSIGFLKLTQIGLTKLKEVFYITFNLFILTLE